MSQRLAQSFGKQAMEIATSLCETPATDFAEYMKRVGQYVALKKAAAEAAEAEREDEDRQ